VSYIVKSVKHVTVKKQDEEEDYYLVNLKEQESGETIKMKLNREPEWSPGTELEFRVTSEQLELVPG